MDQLFDLDLPSTPKERQRGNRFDRAESIIERLEFLPIRGGARAWMDLYRDLKAYAEHYRNIGITHFAEKLELLAARALGAVQRHHLHGPPLPGTLHDPREVLREMLA